MTGKWADVTQAEFHERVLHFQCPHYRTTNNYKRSLKEAVYSLKQKNVRKRYITETCFLHI